MQVVKNFFFNSLSGQEKAWKVFLFGYLIWIIPYSFLYGVLNILHQVYYLILVHMIYTVWLSIAIWKCSNNTSKKIYNLLYKSFAAFLIVEIYWNIQVLLNWKYVL